MDLDTSSAVIATEDVVLALIDHLADPILPLKPPSTNDPPLALQQSIAKQMHAVVLLYNYYHRKQFPQLEFLDYESFCKLAVICKPRLVAYMKHTQSSSDQLPIIEKAIMDACNICSGLDVTREAPCMEAWPITKVAVFLIDSNGENCFLLFSGITDGVWSLIEKRCVSNNKSEESLEAKKSKQKNKISKRPLPNEQSANSASLKKLAVSAVKETTGNGLSDLEVLESHVVYSLSEEKTTAQFYIMKCNKPTKEDVVQVPTEDAIKSLQGPLVMKIGSDCTVTPVVEYFHLLPYAGIVEDWLKRKMLPNDSLLLQEGQGNIYFSPRTSEPVSIAATENFDGSNNDCQTEAFKTSEPISVAASEKTVGSNKGCQTAEIKTSENLNVGENNEFRMKGLSDNFCRPQSMDGGKSLTVPHSSGQRNIASSNYLVGNAEKSSTECDLSSTENGFTDMEHAVSLVKETCNKESTDTSIAGRNDIHMIGSPDKDKTPARDYPIVPLMSDSPKLDKLQGLTDSKRNELYKASFSVILRKRNELTRQQRHLDDEIARCEKSLQTILSGKENDLMLEMDSIIETCNDAAGSYKEMYVCQEHSPKCLKRKRLSEALLYLQNPCKELDDICCENNWILARYSVFPSEEGFHARVILKGVDFECFAAGDMRTNPRMARESAAAHALSKLRSMANNAQDSQLSKV